MIKVVGDPIIQWIERRIKKNKNVILIINGATGSGKTYAGLYVANKIAKKLGTNFSVEENVAFDFENLIKKTKLPQNTKPGTPFLFEEVGAVGSGSAARSWQSKLNQMFFSFLQTTRVRNQILIFTCPMFSYLEKGARSLVHMQLEMLSINLGNNLAYSKAFVLQTNSRTGKIYFKYLKIKIDGRKIRYKKYKTKLPPKEITEPYELAKEKFLKKLDEYMMNSGKGGKQASRKEFDVELLLLLLKEGLKPTEIANKMGYSRVTIHAQLNKLKSKPGGLIMPQNTLYP